MTTRAYLDALKAHGLHYTRIYPAALVRLGAYFISNTPNAKHPELVRRQEDFIRKIVEEVNAYHNVILEIGDEPLSYGTPAALAGPGSSTIFS